MYLDLAFIKHHKEILMFTLKYDMHLNISDGALTSANLDIIYT